MSIIKEYLPHFPGGVPEHMNRLVFTTIIPFVVKEITGEVTEQVHAEVEDNFRVKFRENFRVKFSVKGKQLNRMIEMVMKLSSRRPLIVKNLANEYKVSIRTIHEDLRRLEGWDIMKFEGPPKTGKYVLTENGKAILKEAGQYG